MKWWNEHFISVLNRPEPVVILPPGKDLDIKADNVKNGKAAGVDGISPEGLEYGGEEIMNTCINY